jgi:hypothetical protein
MELNKIIDNVMEQMPRDSSGKWVAVNDVRETLENVLHPEWDHYSDLPSPSAYQQMKGEIS